MAYISMSFEIVRETEVSYCLPGMININTPRQGDLFLHLDESGAEKLTGEFIKMFPALAAKFRDITPDLPPAPADERTEIEMGEVEEATNVL